MQPIIIQKTRVLRPIEAIRLINSIPKRESEIQFKFLLLTGMRYVEAKRFQQNPNWFDGNFIHLPKIATKTGRKDITLTKKKKEGEKVRKPRSQLERWIRLNPLGKEITKSFITLKKPLPTWQGWTSNLERWMRFAKLDPVGMSPKTTRKTWESWLVFYYPDKLTNIVLSQGHTTTTAIQHYLNMPFIQEDRKLMREFVEGWI